MLSKMGNNNAIEQLNKLLQDSREKWESLSFQERRARIKEDSLASLLSVGYITADEAKEYGEPLEELPTDRKALIVAYLNTELYRDTTPSIREQQERQDFIRSFNLRERGALQGETTIADVLSENERKEFIDGLRLIEEKERIRLAEAYVDSKRRILRRNLVKVILPELALELMEGEPKKGELDPIPYERERLEELGYRFKAKSLNDGDKAAIEKLAEEIADYLELAYLNGQGRTIYDELTANDDGNGNYKETFEYRNIFDELISGYPLAFAMIEEGIEAYYTAETARELRSASASMVREYKNIYPDRAEIVQGSKFAYLINEED